MYVSKDCRTNIKNGLLIKKYRSGRIGHSYCSINEPYKTFRLWPQSCSVHKTNSSD